MMNDVTVLHDDSSSQSSVGKLCEKISELHRIWNSKPQALDNQLRFVVRIRFHPLYARHQYDAAGCRPSCKRSSFEPERLDRFIPCCVLRPVEKTLCSREKSCQSNW